MHTASMKRPRLVCRKTDRLLLSPQFARTLDDLKSISLSQDDVQVVRGGKERVPEAANYGDLFWVQPRADGSASRRVRNQLSCRFLKSLKEAAASNSWVEIYQWWYYSQTSSRPDGNNGSGWAPVGGQGSTHVPASVAAWRAAGKEFWW